MNFEEVMDADDVRRDRIRRICRESDQLRKENSELKNILGSAIQLLRRLHYDGRKCATESLGLTCWVCKDIGKFEAITKEQP